MYLLIQIDKLQVSEIKVAMQTRITILKQDLCKIKGLNRACTYLRSNLKFEKVSVKGFTFVVKKQSVGGG